MNEKFKATLKSSETEDWLDLHVIRPFCYYCAVVFAKLDVHPNTVTIWSMIIGAASAFFFAFGSFYYEGAMGLTMNIVAIVMLMIADVLDCTDGQLARMTGKKSQMGRILDGMAGFVWFIPIYIAIVYRFYYHHDIEFGWFGIENTEENTMIATAIVFVLALISGFTGMGGQQRLADYYIQVHLYFLKGDKGSELDNSVTQQKIYDETPWKGNLLWKNFLKSYIDYTKKQEAATPEFQRLMKTLKEKYGDVSEIPMNVREEILYHSRKVMPWNAALTFNFRTAFFWMFCLCDIPAWNFVWEILGMGMLWAYTRYRHESFCKKIADSLLRAPLA